MVAKTKRAVLWLSELAKGKSSYMEVGKLYRNSPKERTSDFKYSPFERPTKEAKAKECQVFSLI